MRDRASPYSFARTAPPACDIGRAKQEKREKARHEGRGEGANTRKGAKKNIKLAVVSAARFSLPRDAGFSAASKRGQYGGNETEIRAPDAKSPCDDSRDTRNSRTTAATRNSQRQSRC